MDPRVKPAGDEQGRINRAVSALEVPPPGWPIGSAPSLPAVISPAPGTAVLDSAGASLYNPRALLMVF
jgi:hypothetical protein